MADIQYQTVVETRNFIQKADRLLTKNEIAALVYYLANNPEEGDLVQGTGGIRKLRWKRHNKGKSGGVRVIYFYYNSGFPLFLLDVYGKNEKDNLSKAERNELEKLTDILVRTYRRKK